MSKLQLVTLILDTSAYMRFKNKMQNFIPPEWSQFWVKTVGILQFLHSWDMTFCHLGEDDDDVPILKNFLNEL